MTNILQVDTGTSTPPVLFEVDELPAKPSERVERVTRRGANVVGELDEGLTEALDRVRPAAHAVIDTFRDLDLDAIDIEFGLKLNAEAGAVIAKTGVEGHFTVKIAWKPSSRQPSQPADSANPTQA